MPAVAALLVGRRPGRPGLKLVVCLHGVCLVYAWCLPGAEVAAKFTQKLANQACQTASKRVPYKLANRGVEQSGSSSGS